MEGKLFMKKIFQQPAAHIELDERELEQITGGSCSRKHKHLPPPAPRRHNSLDPRSGIFGGQPGGQQGGQPGGFGGH